MEPARDTPRQEDRHHDQHHQRGETGQPENGSQDAADEQRHDDAAEATAPRHAARRIRLLEQQLTEAVTAPARHRGVDLGAIVGREEIVHAVSVPGRYTYDES